MRKIFVIGVACALFFVAVTTQNTSAATTGSSDNAQLRLQIESLIKQVQAIQAQLGALSQGAIPASPATPAQPGSKGTPATPAIPAIRACPLPLRYNLYLGLSDQETEGDVTYLQQFLAQDSDVYPEGKISGFFGPLTEQAVKRWQAKQGLVSGGSPDTTGYGVIGPKTRERLRTICGGVDPSPAPIPSPTPIPWSSPTPTPIPFPNPLPTEIPVVPQPVVMPATGAVHVVEPNGGEIRLAGYRTSIGWAAQGDVDDVSIGYRNCRTCETTWLYSHVPVTTVSPSGFWLEMSRDWDIPSSITPGVNYFMHVIGYKNNAEVSSDLSDAPFIISNTPNVTDFSPRSGPAGTMVSVTGSGFTAQNNTVKFGTWGGTLSVIATASSPDGRTLQFTVPAGISAGSYNFQIINANGQGNLPTFQVTATAATSTVSTPLTNTTTCAGAGLSADVYGGPNKQCCSGLVLQGGLCNVPQTDVAPVTTLNPQQMASVLESLRAILQAMTTGEQINHQ